MAELYIPSKGEIPGPWLIEKQQLEELDQIFEFASQKIEESTNKEIVDTAKAQLETRKKSLDELIKELSSYSNRPKKVVTLLSKDGKFLSDKTLKGILVDPKIKDFAPKEILLEIERNRSNSFELSIKRRFDGELSYKVICYDSSASAEIKYKVEDWIDKYKPNKPTQIWNKQSFFLGLLGALCIMIFSNFVVSKQVANFQTIYKTEIEGIIKTGVNNQNETKAIELLLKHALDYKPNNIKEIVIFNKHAFEGMLFGILIAFISFVKPKTTIGIGKHKALIRVYKYYIKFVLISIPSFFILAPVFEWIRSIL
jgi:hypothetical protein